MSETFSIVIANYNGEKFLSQVISCLLASEFAPEKIIVVDDASTDNSIDIVKKFPQISLIKNSANLGPTASRNIGARNANSKYIVFLDNDILVKPDTFIKFLEQFKEQPSVGIVGANILNQNNQQLWWNMGHNPNNFREAIGYFFGIFIRLFPKNLWLKKIASKFIRHYGIITKPTNVSWVAEGCFIIKKEFFDNVGGFDEQFWMFFEGPDLCYRIKKQGKEIIYNPSIVVKTTDGHTHPNNKRAYLHLKSKYLFYKKHYFYTKSNPVLYWAGRTISGLLFTFANATSRRW